MFEPWMRMQSALTRSCWNVVAPPRPKLVPRPGMVEECHVRVASIVTGAAVLITWVTIVRCCCLSARRSWREAAVWTEFSRAYHDLDRGLHGIWDQR